MSGGFWNYREQAIRDLGQDLSEHANTQIAALGNRLIEMAELVRQIDFVLCGDNSEWDEDLFNRLVGPGVVLDMAIARALVAKHELDAAIEAARPPSPTAHFRALSAKDSK